MNEEENASAVKEFYGLLLGGEAEKAIHEYLTPEFEWDNPLPEPIPYGGTFKGPEGAARYLELIFGILDLSEFTINEVVAKEDRVIVLGHETAEVKTTGSSYTQDWVHVLRLRDGKIEHLREYNDTAAMRDAFA